MASTVSRTANKAAAKQSPRAPKPELERMESVSFKALPGELDRWRRAAAAVNRTVSNWLRLRLLESDKREDAIAALNSEQKDGQ